MARPLRVGEYKLTIEEIFQGGRWNWDRISYDLPREIIKKTFTFLNNFFFKEDILLYI